jgi:hypothetical protein
MIRAAIRGLPSLLELKRTSGAGGVAAAADMYAGTQDEFKGDTQAGTACCPAGKSLSCASSPTDLQRRTFRRHAGPVRCAAKRDEPKVEWTIGHLVRRKHALVAHACAYARRFGTTLLSSRPPPISHGWPSSARLESDLRARLHSDPRRRHTRLREIACQTLTPAAAAPASPARRQRRRLGRPSSTGFVSLGAMSRRCWRAYQSPDRNRYRGPLGRP